MRTRVLSFWLLVLTVSVAAVAWSQSASPSLGDVAKQKSERRAQRVVTDDDMPQRTPPPAAENAASGTEAKAEGQPGEDNEKTAAAAQPGAANTRPNQYLSRRVADLRDSEAAEERIIKKLEEALKAEDLTDIRRKIYIDSLEQAHATLDSFRTQRQALEEVMAKEAPKPETAEGEQEQKPEEPKNGEPKIAEQAPPPAR